LSRFATDFRFFARASQEKQPLGARNGRSGPFRITVALEIAARIHCGTAEVRCIIIAIVFVIVFIATVIGLVGCDVGVGVTL